MTGATPRLFSVILSVCILFSASCSSTKSSSVKAVFEGSADSMFVDIPLPDDTIPILTSELPPREVNEVDFYRIQIFAGAVLESAQKVKESMQKVSEKDVYLIKDMDLWKVQIGDYFSRFDVEKDIAKYRRFGWTDAWAIQARKSAALETVEQKPEQLKRTETLLTVQVLASRSEQEATALMKNLELLNINNVRTKFDRNLWKVQVGKYRDRAPANAMLRQIKEMGFNDSWVTSALFDDIRKDAGNSLVGSEVKTENIVTGEYFIQVLATNDEIIAHSEARKIYLLTEERAYVSRNQNSWVVRTGPYSSENEANQMNEKFIKIGFLNTRILK